MLYESLIAIQKIRDRDAAPKIRYLLRDLNEKSAIRGGRDNRNIAKPGSPAGPGRRAEPGSNGQGPARRLTAIAMMPDESSRSQY